MIQYIEVGLDLSGNKIYGRIDEDGLMRVTCTAENPDYQAWLNSTEQSAPNLPPE
jgi:hypothetical protein